MPARVVYGGLDASAADPSDRDYVAITSLTMAVDEAPARHPRGRRRGPGLHRRNRGQRETGAALTLEWLDGCGLFKPLDEGEPAYSSGALLEEVAELLRDLAINAHAMVEGEVPEQRVPRRNDMLVVFDESLFAEVGLVNLTFGFALVEEPVVTKGLGVLLLRQSENLGCLGFEPLELAWADLQTSDNFQIVHDFPLNGGTVLVTVPVGALPTVKRLSVRDPDKGCRI